MNSLWLPASPFFVPQLVVQPIGETRLEVRDCDGQICNSIVISSENDLPVSLDAEAMIAACKLDSGMKHGVVYLSAGRGLVSLKYPGGTTVITRGLNLRDDLGGVIPFSCGDEKRTQLIACVNSSSADVEIRVRCLLQGRSPEFMRIIPAYGARLVSIQADFQELVSQVNQPSVGYLKLSLRSGSGVSIHSLERCEAQGALTYSSITNPSEGVTA